MPGIENLLHENFPEISIPTLLILNVVHHCIVLCHLASNLGSDEWCGDTEVEGEKEGEDCEQGVQVQHCHHLILAQTGLLNSRTLAVDGLLLAVHTTHSHPIRHMTFLVCACQGFMVRGNVALEGELERVIGDNQVQARIESCPPPHVLSVGVESPDKDCPVLC